MFKPTEYWFEPSFSYITLWTIRFSSWVILYSPSNTSSLVEVATDEHSLAIVEELCWQYRAWPLLTSSLFSSNFASFLHLVLLHVLEAPPLTRPSTENLWSLWLWKLFEELDLTWLVLLIVLEVLLGDSQVLNPTSSGINTRKFLNY